MSNKSEDPRLVMAGLDPVIHALGLYQDKAWMPGTRPGMTPEI
jgi:hypothetical protein